MAKRDYYEVLGLQRGASDADLKAAFRKLAMKHHPDRNPGDKDCEHRFKELNEAYDVLKDGQKRAAYDRFGHAAFEHGARRRRRRRLRHRVRLDLRRHFRRSVRHGRRPPRTRLRARARGRSALQHGNHPGRGVRRQDGPDPHSHFGHLRHLLGHGREGRHQAENLRDLQRRREKSATRKASSPSSAPVRPAMAAAR